MHDQINTHQPISSPEAAKDLTDASLHAVAHHRIADFAACGNSESDIPRLVGVKVDRYKRSVPLRTEPVTTHVVRAPAQPLVSAQPFTRG